jgi:hypothetical protein
MLKSGYLREGDQVLTRLVTNEEVMLSPPDSARASPIPAPADAIAMPTISGSAGADPGQRG